MTGRSASSLARRYVRNRVEAQMTSRVTIYRNSNPSFDSSSGVYTAHKGTQVYTGKARIYGVDGAGVTQVGEGDFVNRQTYITIPGDAKVPHVDDVVVITHSVDTDLVGRAWRVIAVDGGSILMHSRRLTVTGVMENRDWSGQ